MSNPISLPEPNMRPGGYLPPGPVQPNAIDNFLHMYLEGRQLKGNEDAQKAQTAIATGRLKLEQERVKLDQERERTAQTERDAQGGALQQMLKALAPAIEQHAQSHPEVVQGVMGGQGGPQGQPAPQQGTPQAPPQQPMQRFAQIVASLPPGAVPDFVKNFRGVAEGAQQKVDEGVAFNEAQRLTKGLLTPTQQDQMMTAWHLQRAGAPKEMWESMLPTQQIELAKGVEELRGIKDSVQSDTVATAKLVDLGLIPRSGVTQLVVKGAAKMYYDYVADVRKDARAAAMVRQKEDREKDVQGLKGTAMEISLANPDWSPAQIKSALKATPAYAGLPDGVVAQAALEAPKNVTNLTAPPNETVAKARMVYGPARGALAVVNAMDAKGESLGMAARAAQMTSSGAGMGGGTLGGTAGAALGSVVPGVGTAIGGVVGGLAGAGLGYVGAPAIRAAGRAAMSKDQQRLWTSVESVAAAIYRPESGAAVTPDEIRTTVERYFPLSTDQPETKKLKRQLRDELDKTLANISGLPQQLQQSVLDALLSKHEQELLKNGPSAPAPRPVQTNPGLGPTGQRPWR